MTLFSEFLNYNISFPENNEDDKTPHDVLEEIILYELNAEVHYKVISCQGLHCVCLCSIEKGERSMEGIGETHEETLAAGIAQRYPVRMARKRAFDFAAVRFLKLPIKDYEKLVAREDPEGAVDSFNNGSTNEQPERPKKSQLSSQTNDSASAEDYSKTIVTIGRHKGENLTVSELAEKDLDSLNWIVNTYPQTVKVLSEERRKVVDACSRWVKEHNAVA